MKKSFVSLLVGLTLSSPFYVNAEEAERWFEVEVILFDRSVNPANISEHWNDDGYAKPSTKSLDPLSQFYDQRKLKSTEPFLNISQTCQKTLAEKLSNNFARCQTELNLAKIEAETYTALASLDQANDAKADPSTGAADDSVQLMDETGLPEILEPGIEENTAPMAEKVTAIKKPAPILSSTRITYDGARLIDSQQLNKLKMVPENELQLTKQFKALNNHANYNVLLHTAWRMAPVVRQASVPIRLFGGRNFQTQYDANGEQTFALPKNEQKPSETEHLALAEDDHWEAVTIDSTEEVVKEPQVASATEVIALPENDNIQETQAVNPNIAINTKPVWQLDGELTIYLEHYLYAKTDLYLRKIGTKTIKPIRQDNKVIDQLNEEDPLQGITLDNSLALVLEQDTDESILNGIMAGTIPEPPESVEVPFLRSYPLQQLRVIRSGEIHYLDHPMFGMIIQIRKYQPPVKTETEELAE